MEDQPESQSRLMEITWEVEESTHHGKIGRRSSHGRDEGHLRESSPEHPKITSFFFVNDREHSGMELQWNRASIFHPHG